MKFKKIWGSLFVLICVLMFSITPLCFADDHKNKTSFKQVKQETRDLMQALKGYTSDQKDEAVRETKAALDKLDNRIDALENRIDKSWDKMSQSAREKTRASLKALRKQRNHVAEWYGSLKHSTADAWGHMKKGFSKAYKTLHKSWEKAENEYESGK